ncbi:MAG TPA: hypothetical protein VN442_17375 [Bryobacteraceae bacterium]|nr:hypothetical protein [Bryobacteraceae bacterium]
MSSTITTFGSDATSAERSVPSYQAYQILHLGFTVAPIVAGVDKYFHFLCNWDQYLAPWVIGLSPVGGHNLMLIVGVIEMAAGILVAVRPRLGAPIVGAWLSLIILNLLTMGSYLDVALRDLGLALGAFALWRLAQEFAHR